jgi:hypothetical protein
MRGRGKSKVILGSNYSLLTPARALAKLPELNLGAEAEALLLAGNARRDFRPIT